MITRSVGTPVTVAGIPYLVGGGYTGETKELDDMVQRAAEMLADAFKWPVEIRFNSDRQSGGAFVNDPANPHKTRFGLSAGLRHVKPEGMSLDAWVMASGAFRESQPQVLYIATYITAQWLQNPSQANFGNYDSREHATLEDGLAYLCTQAETGR